MGECGYLHRRGHCKYSPCIGESPAAGCGRCCGRQISVILVAGIDVSLAQSDEFKSILAKGFQAVVGKGAVKAGTNSRSEGSVTRVAGFGVSDVECCP